MEVVIQNYLLFKNATDAGGRAWALEGLQSLMSSLSSPFHLPDVLKKVAKNALLTLDADNVTLYQYQMDKGTIVVPPVAGGCFRALSSLRYEISQGDILSQLIENGESFFEPDVTSHPILGKSREDGNPRFAVREGIRSCAALILKLEESKEVVGLLFVNFRSPHYFSVEERRVMYALARSAGLAIRTARLHKADVSGTTRSRECCPNRDRQQQSESRARAKS